ncbi:hypothetical protein VE04_09067 [Pseudogymnoascus sp. 24MN13]|nr:hypothetical protein VE04_09067 [Pseudogymnoascus sp. 24MN13]
MPTISYQDYSFFIAQTITAIKKQAGISTARRQELLREGSSDSNSNSDSDSNRRRQEACDGKKQAK